MTEHAPEILLDARGRPYVPAVRRGLKKWLWLIFLSVAFLSANGAYLAAVRVLEVATGQGYQNPFYFWMFLLHIAVGVVVILPYLYFGVSHLRTAILRPNRRAVNAGIALFSVGCLVIVTGLMLLKNVGPLWNSVAYWSHVSAPLVAFALYIVHRLAGPAIAWRWAAAWGGSVLVLVGALTFLHTQDPRSWNQVGPKEGVAYFEPSLARTASGNFIPAEVLAQDEYCLKCHADTYGDWFHSAHHFSSFNNPAYRFSVRETRRVALERDRDTKASRWCAGCHDLVPFLSGKFDDPNYDDFNDPTAHAGITCTGCHAITHVNSTRGNGDYTIEEPLHYPFAFSENPVLQWINERLIKANPSFHKRTFLKPLHKTAEFCSTCHKVHIPFALNKYKPFLRGQNHYDTYLLSGVSGHGARSFYYPETAKPNCSEGCHMPLVDSTDFGHREGKIHDHLFPGGNTGLAALRGHAAAIAAQKAFLEDGQVRVDIFGLREGGKIDGRLLAPLRPVIPEVEPGATYLVEVVVRTLKLGHPLTQGTVDSNELWVEVIASSGGRILGSSGAMDARGLVDPWSHFINVYMLDRDGNRIDRRNPQDIFVPLYNHQIPPGAGQSIHYRLEVPRDLALPLEISARVRYRKFDLTYMEHVFGKDSAPDLPVVDFSRDSIRLPVRGLSPEAAILAQTSPIIPWQRWNDYGIGLLLKGSLGAEKGELRQAEEVFRKVADLGRPDGWVNLGRVYDKEGRLEDAVEVLRRAMESPDSAPAWTVSWLAGRVNRQNGFLDAAIRDFENVLSMRVPARGFDFSLDYEVRNELGLSLLDRAQRSPGGSDERRGFLLRSREAFRATLAADGENKDAHYNLYLISMMLGEEEEGRRHLERFNHYRPDDNASDRAAAAARARNAAANKAAQSIVIYDLRPTP